MSTKILLIFVSILFLLVLLPNTNPALAATCIRDKAFGECSCSTTGCNGLQYADGHWDDTYEYCLLQQSCNTTPGPESCDCNATGGTGHTLVSCDPGSQCTGALGDGCHYCQTPVCTFVRTSNQCGAVADACANHPAAIAGSHTVQVDQYTCRYDCTDLGQLPEQCTNPATYACSGSTCAKTNNIGDTTDSNCNGTCTTPWATLTSDCSGTTPQLHANWGNIVTHNNIYIQAGGTGYTVGTTTSGSWNGSTLPGGPAVVLGGTYQLYADAQTPSTTSPSSCTTTHYYRCSGTSCIQDDTSRDFTTSNCNNSCGGNSTTYVSPTSANVGTSVVITATTSLSCSTDVNFPIPGGVTSCSDTGWSCSGNPMSDGKPCWFRHSCTAQTAGSYTASYNASGAGCYSSQNYTVTNPVPPTPTISAMPGCIPNNNYNGSGFTISWGSISPAVTYVDISTVSGFSSFSNKAVSPAGSLTVTGAGFSNGFTFNPGIPYYVRTWNGVLHSNTATFTTPDVCLTASCSVAPASIAVSGSADWTAAPLGGTGSYTYSWSGTDSLSGNTQTVRKTYTTAGTKTGQVIVTSGTQTVTAPCSNSLNVTSPPCPPSVGYPTGGIGACGGSPTGDAPAPNTIDTCNGTWHYNPGIPATAPLAYNIWCAANTNIARGYCYQCTSSYTPWIQTTGDVHSNTEINASGGPP